MWSHRCFLLVAAVAAYNASVRAASDDASASTAAEWSNERSEIELQRFLNRWIRAQNGGDFKAYMSLYGERFEGTRGSGSQTLKLDRPRWERESQVVFAKPIHVRLFFVETVPAGDSPEVSFVQLLTTGRTEEVSVSDHEARDRTVEVRREFTTPPLGFGRRYGSPPTTRSNSVRTESYPQSALCEPSEASRTCW